MAVFQRFNAAAEDIARGVHDLHADTLKIFLTNDSPSSTADAVKADLTEISAGSGYTAGGVDMQNAVSRTLNVASVTGVDATITASGGSIGPFRAAVLYNDTAASDNLLGFWDYGSSTSLADGEALSLDVGAALMTVTIS